MFFSIYSVYTWLYGPRHRHLFNSSSSWCTIYSMMLKCCGCVCMMGNINTMRYEARNFFLSTFETAKKMVLHGETAAHLQPQELSSQRTKLYTLATGAACHLPSKIHLSFSLNFLRLSLVSAQCASKGNASYSRLFTNCVYLFI